MILSMKLWTKEQKTKYGINFWKLMVFIFLFLPVFLHNAQSEQNFQNKYICIKTSEKIVIDGRLSENAWKKAPQMLFKEMADGSEPEYRTVAKVIWDDNYLYIGCEVEDSDVWVRTSMKDSECPKDYVERVNIHRYMEDPEWKRLECDIMTFDNFIKIFLDPDADSLNYMEFHINPANNIFDAWYERGLVRPGQVYLESPHVSWTCPKLISATFMNGTLNAPHDMDLGWSFEMAIPWESIKEFTGKKCVPVHGDVWGMMLGRVHRDYSWASERFYWTWPVVGSYMSHDPSLYGKLVFSEKPVRLNPSPKMKISNNALKKPAILFVSGSGIPEEIIPEAKKIGASGFLCQAYPLEQLRKFVEKGKKYNVDIYATISLADVNLWRQKRPGITPPLQRMNPEEIQVYEYLKDKNARFATDYQWGEEPKGRKTEVLIQDLLCFHDRQVREFFKEQIQEILEIEGLKGIGFDFFGYQNYRCCMCDISETLFRQCGDPSGNMSVERAREKFSLESLVSFYNELSNFARSIRPDVRIITHIYPVFLPEPFYGNRLDLDYCCHTAAWFLPWSAAKIARTTKKMVADEKNIGKEIMLLL